MSSPFPPDLPHQLASLLAPYLPYLMAGAAELGKGAATEAGKKLTQAGLDRARQLWDRVHPALATNADAQNAIRIAAARPDDPRALGPLEMQLEDAFQANPALAREVAVTIYNLRQGGIDIADSDVHFEGDVTGGDRIGDVYHVKGDLYQSGSAPSRGSASLREFYLRRLAAACAELPFGVLDPRFFELTGAHPLNVGDVYVGLDVLAPAVREQERGFLKPILHREPAPESTGQPDRIPILDALTRADLKRVVLLGEMGSGKSTFVQYLAFVLALLRQDVPNSAELLPADSPLAALFPVRLILRDAFRQIPVRATRGSASMLWDALRGDLVERLGSESDADAFLPELRTTIQRQPTLILLDGLDEVPEANDRRAHLLQAIADFSSGLPDATRVVVTAHPYAYADPQWRLAHFESVTLAPFDEDQVESFIKQWYRAIAPSLSYTEQTALGKAAELRAALSARPDLADIASRPLLLTLMATLSSSGGTLPNDRFGLYEDMVQLLFDRWQRARVIQDADGKWITDPGIEKTLKLDPKVIRGALNALAFRAHKQQREQGANADEPADISQAAVLDAFAPLLDANTNPGVILRYLNERAGLLSSRKPEVYAFPHRSFQEFLAGCHISAQVQSARLLQELVAEDALWWRETALWMAGRTNIDGVIEIARKLLPQARGHAASVTVMARRAAVLAGMILAQAGDAHIGEPDYDAPRRDVVESLVAILEEGAFKPPERAEAGRVLARLGDPRPGVLVPILKPGQLHVPRLLWCEIPPGSFPLGNTKQTDPEADDRETPRIEYTKLNYPYYLSRYPVTNAQFDAFVNDPDGYRRDEWWTAVRPDLRYDRISARMRGRLVDFLNHPVVAVTWFEAYAFARWLDQHWRESGAQLEIWRPGVDAPFSSVSLSSDYHVRLPTEAEWEKAASWDAQRKIKSRYPWGEDPDPNRANYDDTGIGTTSVVGCFPNGTSPCGALDMSGNVWEWCATSWVGSYRNYPQEENNSTEGGAARVVRGGSFVNVSRVVRCAARPYPGNFNDLVGFRVCVAPAAP